MDDIQARLLNAGFRAGYRLGFDDALHGGPRDSDAKAALFLAAVESAQTELAAEEDGHGD